MTARANGVAYKLYISLPPGYDTTRTTYPVVYMLDADYSFPIAYAVTLHLTERLHLPPVVLVGVAYAGPPAYQLNRTRDYTPTHVDTGGSGPAIQRASGGGPRLRSFMQEQLLPFVEAEYRVNQDRTLVGHSYGGLFALWVGVTEPRLFSRVLAVSPSLWYDDHMLARLEQQVGASRASPRPKIYITAGDLEAPVMAEDALSFSRQLLRRDSSTRIRSEILSGETHNSIFPTGFSRGLRWLLSDLGAR